MNQSNKGEQLIKYISSLGEHINLINQKLEEFEIKIENISEKIEDLKKTVLYINDIDLPQIESNLEKEKVLDKEWLSGK
jgi:hypothetical protein